MLRAAFETPERLEREAGEEYDRLGQVRDWLRHLED